MSSYVTLGGYIIIPSLSVLCTPCTSIMKALLLCLQLPILSTGEGVGCLVCLCEGVSAVSGRWRVEECGGEGGGGEGGRVRRLVFLSTSHLVQTEMRLRPGIACSDTSTQYTPWCSFLHRLSLTSAYPSTVVYPKYALSISQVVLLLAYYIFVIYI